MATTNSSPPIYVQDRVRWVALEGCFDTHVKRSSPTLYSVTCKDPSCSWEFRASKWRKTSLWKVRKYVQQHSCNVNARRNHQRQATASLVGGNILSSLTGDKNPVTPKIIQSLAKSQLGVGCSYWKARRVKGTVRNRLYGTDEESYRPLPAYLYMIGQANPGSHTWVEWDANNQFKYAFVSLGAWVRAIPHLRKVISAPSIAAAMSKGTDVYSLVNDVYKIPAWWACYTDVIYPLPPRDSWVFPSRGEYPRRKRVRVQ